MKIPVENHHILKDGASFCYCAYVSRISGYSGFLRNCLLIKQRFYEYVEKADLSKGYQNPKRKLGVTTHFSEITELKFGKKLPYILCMLTLFEN